MSEHEAQTRDIVGNQEAQVAQIDLDFAITDSGLDIANALSEFEAEIDESPLLTRGPDYGEGFNSNDTSRTAALRAERGFLEILAKVGPRALANLSATHTAQSNLIDYTRTNYRIAVSKYPHLRWYQKLAQLLPPGKMQVVEGRLQIAMSAAEFRAVAPFIGDFKEEAKDFSPLARAVASIAAAHKKQRLEASLAEAHDKTYLNKRADHDLAAHLDLGGISDPLDGDQVAKKDMGRRRTLDLGATDLSNKAIVTAYLAQPVAKRPTYEALSQGLIDKQFSPTRVSEILRMARIAERQSRRAVPRTRETTLRLIPTE